MVDISSTLWNVLYYVTSAGIVLILVVVGILIYKYKQYKFTVVLFKKRANGQTEVSFDKGGYFKTHKGEAEVFRLRKNKQLIIKPVLNKYIYPNNLIFLRYVGEKQYFPFNFSFDEDTENDFIQELDYEENISWYLSTRELIRETFSLSNVWEKYGVYIMAMLSFIMVIITIYLILKYAKDVTGAIQFDAEQTSKLMEWIKATKGGDAP